MATSFGIDLEPQLDRPLARQPDDPAVGENWGFWLFDEGGGIGVHTHIQREEGLWEHAREYVHVFLGNGRYLRVWGSGPGIDADTTGGANVRARSVDPFRRWTYHFKGIMFHSRSADVVSGPMADRGTERATVEIALEMTMAAPPWVQGTLSESAREAIRQGGYSTGGFRYEQLLRVSGTVTVDGVVHPLNGGGLRTHRAGLRDLSGFYGHSWGSAIFPDGRGFGYQLLQSAPGGPWTYHEGYVLQDGKLHAAEVINAPGLPALTADGDRFPIVLRSDLGDMAIEGEVIHNAMVTIVKGVPQQPAGFYPFGLDTSRDDNTPMPQSGVRYTLDGQVTVNMMERSAAVSELGLK